MFKNLFKSKNEVELLKESERLKLQVEKLEEELRKKNIFLKCKNTLINDKEIFLKHEKNWNDIEEQLKKFHSENKELKEILKDVEKFISLKTLNYNYLVPIEKYFTENRFKEVISILKKENKNYIQNIDFLTIDQLDVDNTLKENIVKKYNNFISKDIPWDVKTHLIKGEKISKLYQKHRKFLNILTNDNIEYVCDLENFNFNNLSESGYSEDEILTLKTLYDEYIEEYRIKI